MSYSLSRVPMEAARCRVGLLQQQYQPQLRNTNSLNQPAFDVSMATQAMKPLTTKVRLPRNCMKWTSEINSFVSCTDMNFIARLSNTFLTSSISLNNAAQTAQRPVIIMNNLLPEPILQQIWGEVILEMHIEYGDYLAKVTD